MAHGLERDIGNALLDGKYGSGNVPMGLRSLLQVFMFLLILLPFAADPMKAQTSVAAESRVSGAAEGTGKDFYLLSAMDERK